MNEHPRVSILGYGRVGLPLAQTLQKKGFSVSGTVTSTEKQEQLTKQGFKTTRLSFTPDAEGDISAITDCDILVVTAPPSMQAPADYPVIMKNIARAAAAGQVQKVLLISTTSVYHQSGIEVREDDASHEAPAFFGISWLAIEEIFTQSPGFETTVIRCSGLMGGTINPGAYFAGRELKGASNPVNMLHIDDCVDILAQIIEKEIWGEIFNASADQHPSKQAFYTRACQTAGLPMPTFSDEEAPFRIVNNDKLKQQLNYVLKYPDPLTGL